MILETNLLNLDLLHGMFWVIELSLQEIGISLSHFRHLMLMNKYNESRSPLQLLRKY